MAVYQYFIAVVPEEGLLKKHEQLPKSIRVSTASGYFESDVKLYWQACLLDLEEVLPRIDQLVERAPWSNNETNFSWKSYNDEVDHDACLYLDEKTQQVSDFHFRVDLREKELLFIKGILQLATANNWLLMDIKGNLMKPVWEEMKDSLLDSNAYKFLKDPIAFLEKGK